ncbi:MAG: hypothetical protein R2852_06585 [Bacteroidia bacterium]
MKDSINHQHLLCEDWKREIAFYKDELPVLRKRLEEVVSKNTDHDLLKKVEHFENKFRIMDTHFDELLHDVNAKDNALKSQAAAKPTYIHLKIVDTADNLEELMEITSKDFQETRKDYYRFLSKVM